MSSREHDEVCDDEANRWRLCVESHLGEKDVADKCSPRQQEFDICIGDWRKRVGPSVKVKGVKEGEPPFQCEAMSCLVGECLRKYNYDFGRCKQPMDSFKHCVKQFYGSSYISE